jgi:hypothetical protein
VLSPFLFVFARLGLHGFSGPGGTLIPAAHLNVFLIPVFSCQKKRSKALLAELQKEGKSENINYILYTVIHRYKCIYGIYPVHNHTNFFIKSPVPEGTGTVGTIPSLRYPYVTRIYAD